MAPVSLARCCLALLALLLLGPASPSPSPPPDPFAAQLGGLAQCQAHCQAQAAPGPQDAVLNACYRGCRLFSICHFVDATAELNATRAECESACMEAYMGGEEQFGCMLGCRTQLPVTESMEEKAQDSKLGLSSVFDLVSNFCNDIVSSAQSFISSTWTFYLQADDGKVMVFQVSFVLREKLERPLVEETKSKAKIQDPAETQTPPEHDFLGCMSKRSGLPRWILAACLFLSIVVMLWLSCASLVTALDQHVKTQV
ncbi:transmembrane protein 59-like [Sceloporus undulatus]|uniref:transmembrane protein 59-like n=1 Tax=Sceloporus undulatus TaxID=8520 RepID=UPI001C4BD375|nr:transmembrane protein 59-like [Sceloporus undulatus]